MPKRSIYEICVQQHSGLLNSTPTLMFYPVYIKQAIYQSGKQQTSYHTHL